MRKTIKFVAVLAAMTLLFAACGDDDADGGDSTTLAVTADSFEFTPNAWTIPGNTDVTVTLTNANNVDEHEWAILVAGTTITSEAEFNEDIVLTELEAVQPGESESQVFNLPPGTYQVICALEGHFDGGMTGTLTVTG